MASPIHVGMGDLVVSKPPVLLATLGLGSCIGLVIYDSSTHIAGMVHVMLPDSRDVKNNPKPGKFADTAVPLLISEIEKKGGMKLYFRAKLAGGAQMFSMPGKEGGLFAVGARNIEAVTKLLAQHNVKIAAQDTGGNKGRSIEFDADTFRLTVKTLGSGVKEL